MKYLIVLIGLIFPLALSCQEEEIDSKALECLAKNIYYESRGQPTKGMIAVGAVTLNRTNDVRFPSTICSVVYQPNQFSWTTKKLKIRETTEWEKSVIIARRLLLGLEIDPTNGSVYFHHESIPHHRIKTKIGNHIFY